MTGTLSVCNRQRVQRVNTVLLRRILRVVLDQELEAGSFELCFHLVGAAEMARVNQKFLCHDGSTDVITFNYSEGTTTSKSLCGEIFICLDDAVAQARRFRTTWEVELVRYAIHGLLHLGGYDDFRLSARRAMKREEDRLLRATKRRFRFSKLRLQQSEDN